MINDPASEELLKAAKKFVADVEAETQAAEAEAAKPQLKSSIGGDASVAAVVDDELAKLGWGGTQRRGPTLRPQSRR